MLMYYSNNSVLGGRSCQEVGPARRSAVNLIELRRLAEMTCAAGLVRIWVLLLGQQTQAKGAGGFLQKIFCCKCLLLMQLWHIYECEFSNFLLDFALEGR